MALEIKADAILSKFDFDPKAIRPAMRKIGTDVRRNAMRLFSKKKSAGRGEYPKRQTGAMARSVRYKVSRSGYSVGINYQRTAATEKRGFYPAFLMYGTDKIRPYKNAVQDVVDKNRERYADTIRGVLDDATSVKAWNK